MQGIWKHYLQWLQDLFPEESVLIQSGSLCRQLSALHFPPGCYLALAQAQKVRTWCSGHQTSWVLTQKDLMPQLELPSLLFGLRLSLRWKGRHMLGCLCAAFFLPLIEAKTQRREKVHLSTVHATSSLVKIWSIGLISLWGGTSITTFCVMKEMGKILPPTISSRPEAISYDWGTWQE